MKKLILLLLGACVAGLLSYALFYRYQVAEAAPTDQMQWLRKEFALTDAQFAQVQKLETEYRPICDGHCRDYSAAYAHLTELLNQNRAWTPETRQAVEALYQAEMECHRDLLKHAYEVSAVMSPEQGRRYLAMVESRLELDDPTAMRQTTQ
jgi:hypothetical protein